MFQVHFRSKICSKSTLGDFSRILKLLISTKKWIFVNFDEFWVRERFSLGKVDFMGLVTLDNNLKNIYDVGYSPNEKQFPGYIQKVRAY